MKIFTVAFLVGRNGDFDQLVASSVRIAKKKSGMTIRKRNQCMIERADLVIIYVKHFSGGAYQAMRYAEKIGKKILNLAEISNI